MAALMYLLGFLCLIAAPFSAGISLVTAACFFVIGYVLEH